MALVSSVVTVTGRWILDSPDMMTLGLAAEMNIVGVAIVVWAWLRIEPESPRTTASATDNYPLDTERFREHTDFSEASV